MTVVVQRLSFCEACTIASASLTSSGLMHRVVTGGLSLPGSLPWTSTVVLISHLPGWTSTPAAIAEVALVRKIAAPSSARVGRVAGRRREVRFCDVVGLAIMVFSWQAPALGARAAGEHRPETAPIQRSSWTVGNGRAPAHTTIPPIGERGGPARD